MSYEKPTAAPNTIRFYYVTSDVFNKVKRITAIKAASITKADGTKDFDNIQFAADEEDLFKDFFRTAMLYVFSTCFKIASSDSITHDTAVTLNDASNVTASHISVTDNSKYRTINLDFLDTLVTEALVRFITREWYELKGLYDDAAIHEKKQIQLIADISEKTLTLRLPA